MLFADKELTDYMGRVLEDLRRDSDITKALRRLHIKEVHLRRTGDLRGLRFIRRARRLI